MPGKVIQALSLMHSRGAEKGGRSPEINHGERDCQYRYSCPGVVVGRDSGFPEDWAVLSL